MIENLDRVLPLLVASMTDSDQHVRAAACVAMNQFSRMLRLVIFFFFLHQSYSDHIPPFRPPAARHPGAPRCDSAGALQGTL